MSPPSSQPIASLSSSESAAAISLLALAPGTPPGMSSPVGTPTLAPSASGSGDFGPVAMQAQLSGPALGAAQSPPGGQGQAAEPMDSDMASLGMFSHCPPTCSIKFTPSVTEERLLLPLTGLQCPA